MKMRAALGIRMTPGLRAALERYAKRLEASYGVRVSVSEAARRILVGALEDRGFGAGRL